MSSASEAANSCGNAWSSCRPTRPTRPEHLLEQVEELDRQIRQFEQRIQTMFKPTPAIQHLMTVPGVGLTLAVVIALEVGDVARFPTAEKLASYAGHHAAGPRKRREDALRAVRPDVNRYLKWAFVEAANAICLTRRRSPPATSVASTSASPGARATPRPSGRWPGTWPKRRFGS